MITDILAIAPPCAGPADSVNEPFLGDNDPGVLFIEGVPPFTSGLQGIEPSGVFLQGDRFQMFGPDAVRDVTTVSDMVQVLVGGKRDVNIDAIEPVGNYGVLLRFSDGHATGIFACTFLERSKCLRLASMGIFLRRTV